MQSSKSIKLQVTNNQAHISQANLCIQQVDQRAEQQYLIEFQQSQLDNSDNNEKIIKQQLRSMFTIRQEQSYDYDSQVNTPCIKESQCESVLADLSTIKSHNILINNSHHQNPKNNYSNYAKDPVDIQTMISFVEKELTLNQPQIQSWEEKNKEQVSQKIIDQLEEEKIQDQQFFILKPSQRKLYLNKAKIKLPQKLKLKFDYELKQNNHVQTIKKLNVTIVRNLTMRNKLKMRPIASAQKVR